MKLQISGLTKFFGTKLVFKSIDLCVSAGEVVLIVGPNGCGKSTFLKIVAGAMHPTYGSVKRDDSTGQIGYMGHRTFLYSGLTAWENLYFWARLYNFNLKKTGLEDILARVGLKFEIHEQTAYFSKGMAQRLSLARILVIDPEIWLLDEPASGLDIDSQAILHQEISKARERGNSVLWVSHNFEKDLFWADKVLLFENKSGLLKEKQELV